MKLKKKSNILIVGTGILGAYLSKLLLNKKYKIVISTRKLKNYYSNYKKLNISNKVKFIKLDIQKEHDIKKIINIYKPKHIYYFAGQSSIMKSDKLKKSTIESNYIGAKKILKIIHEKKLKIKFFKANTGYIFQSKNKKINLKCKLIKPNNSYIFSQIKAFNLIKYYRQLGLHCYSIIFLILSLFLDRKNILLKKFVMLLKKKIKLM